MLEALKQQTVAQIVITIATWLAVTALLNLIAHRSQVDAWCEKRPRLAAVLKVARGLGFDPWLLVQGLSLLLKGRLPEKLRNTTPVLLLLVALSAASIQACSASYEQRQLCYAQADIHAAQRAETECKGVEWDACPARPVILDELRQSYMGCP